MHVEPSSRRLSFHGGWIPMRKAIVSLSLLAAILGASAAKAQTCARATTCNTSSIGSSPLSAGSGDGLLGERGGACNSVSVPAAGGLAASLSNDGVVGYTDLGVAGVAG